ncbi:hypothetical protein ID856_09960 [Xenorhabdus sp. 18]|uniref:hypothetical protein n=1 Tax=Xenorhabdus doucetiae TaxID=351671 RepID=UPI0019866DC0|nr:hypothetical protein [Xenorhabdus sp. 18]MBD2796856.1 hypothetical protein [Xenorhabdus sp. 18]
MKMFRFIFNTRLNALIAEGKKLEEKLVHNDPSLKEDIGYKEFKYHFFPFKAGMGVFFVTVILNLLLSSAMIFSIFITYLQDITHDKLTIITSVFISIFWFFLFSYSVFLLGKGNNNALYIHKIMYQLIILISVAFFLLDVFHNVILFFLLVSSALLVKVVMNTRYFYKIITEIRFFRITHVFLSNDMKGIMNMSRKESKRYAREIEAKKRREIRDKKRKNHVK